MSEELSTMQQGVVQIDEGKGGSKVRGSRRSTSKRRTVSEMTFLERRIIPDEFEERGAGSGANIAVEFHAQRVEVLELVVHKLTRQVRRLESWRLMGGNEPAKRPPQPQKAIAAVVRGRLA